MQDLLSIGTNRRESMIGTGIGLGLAGYRFPTAFFNPENISGMQLWLDSADASTLYQSSGGNLASSDGDPVGQWRDKSGNGRHVTQTDGTKKPTLKTAIQNGKNILRFDGTDRFDTPSFSFLSSTYSFFFVGKTTASGYKTILGSNSAGPDYYILQGGSYLYVAGGASTFSTINIINSTKVIGLLSKSNQVKWYGNGVLNTSAVASGLMGNGTYWIGDNRYTDIFTGDMMEILIYGQELTEPQIFSVQAYLNGKWGAY